VLPKDLKQFLSAAQFLGFFRSVSQPLLPYTDCHTRGDAFGDKASFGRAEANP
jgi:hypothetical protein